MTLTKIKICDNAELRNELDALYGITNQVILTRWASLLAKHMLDLAGIDYSNNDVILDSFDISREWQNGLVSVHDVRQSCFRVHQIARQTEDIVERTVYRVVGQSVAVCHMPEHAMVASDYAVKVVNLLYPDDEGAVTAERRWQIDKLKLLVAKHTTSSAN